MNNSFKQKDYKLSGYKLEGNNIFICCVSFEDRSIGIARQIDEKNINRVYAFYINKYAQTQNNLDLLESKYTNKLETLSLSISNPIESYLKISKVTKECSSCDMGVVVDITTFTHEALLILLQSLKKSGCNNIKFIYLGAGEYSVGQTYDMKWLSKGCRDVRNVLGYAGILSSSKPTHLTILTGFENERALGVINELDAESVYVGNGLTTDTHITAYKHADTMQHFKNLYGSLLSTRKGVKFFEFSPKIISSVVLKLYELIRETPEYNHIIVPLNTKVSTLAVGLFALQNKEIQICYSQPELYNIDNYSTIGDKVIECDIDLQNYMFNL